MSNTKPAPIRNPYQKLLESMFEAPDRNFHFGFAATSHYTPRLAPSIFKAVTVAMRVKPRKKIDGSALFAFRSRMDCV
jgi:hypothetical protein